MQSPTIYARAGSPKFAGFGAMFITFVSAQVVANPTLSKYDVARCWKNDLLHMGVEFAQTIVTNITLSALHKRFYEYNHAI